MTIGYAMYDADHHLYEAEDSWTRHLPEHRKTDVYWVDGPRRRRLLVINRQVFDYVPNLTFDPVAVAGQFEDRRGIGVEPARVEPLASHPEYMNRDARLRIFDEQGVEAGLVFPTAANGLVEKVGADIPLYYDMIWAFDRWLDEDWGFSHLNRIYAPPLIPFSDPGRSVELLEWALERGARAVSVAANPALTASGYRSPADPMFDAIWARIQEAGVLVSVHAGANRYNTYTGDWTGNYDTAGTGRRGTVVDQIMNQGQGRVMADYLTALVWHGVFHRFPNLHVASIENRSGWVAPLLDTFRQFFRPGMLPDDPVETFHRCVWLSPHWEEDLVGLAQEMSPEHVLAGSDWPHPDSLAQPTNYVKYLDEFGFDDDVVRKIMRDNLRSLLVAA